jgi:hypothetical protein
MGTNYYIHENPCAHCGRHDEPIHIGKSSAGWKFSFNATIHKTYEEWKAVIEAADGKIFDEYNRPISAKELLDYAASKRGLHDEGGDQYEQVRDGYRFIYRDYS